MDSGLYDDKLAGEITRDTYDLKHASFKDQLAQLEERLGTANRSHTNATVQRTALLELFQRTSQIYRTRDIDQKRLIIITLPKKTKITEARKQKRSSF